MNMFKQDFSSSLAWTILYVIDPYVMFTEMHHEGQLLLMSAFSVKSMKPSVTHTSLVTHMLYSCNYSDTNHRTICIQNSRKLQLGMHRKLGVTITWNWETAIFRPLIQQQMLPFQFLMITNMASKKMAMSLIQKKKKKILSSRNWQSTALGVKNKKYTTKTTLLGMLLGWYSSSFLFPPLCSHNSWQPV